MAKGSNILGTNMHEDSQISHAVHTAGTSHGGYCTERLSQLHLHCLQVAHCSGWWCSYRIPLSYFAEHTKIQYAAEAPVPVQYGMLMKMHFVRCQHYFRTVTYRHTTFW